jgi:hypothetical protein
MRPWVEVRATAGAAGYAMDADSPDVVIAKRLFDHLELRGFRFRRVYPGGGRASGGKPGDR